MGDSFMKKKESITIGEMLKATGKEKSKCEITFLNEPNYKLMAEAAINLYKQNY